MRIPPPDTYVPETRIEHIQGFLRAVEAIGSFVNHGLCLDFGELPLAASTEAALDAYYRQRQGLAAMMIRLTLEPGGVLQVAERFLAFAFEFADTDYGRHWPSPGATPPEAEAAWQRETLGQALIDQLVGLVHRQSIAVWSVLVEDKDPRGDRGATRSHTDLVQEEFVLEAAGARFLLHLGYND